jgi:hypothetical protein
MKTIKKSLTALIAVTAMITTQAQAGQWCSTKINHSLIDGSGNLMGFVAVRGDWLSFCNINTTWKGIAPATCAKWVTYVHSAVARKADTYIYYNEDTACNAIPPYTYSPAPGYIMLIN